MPITSFQKNHAFGNFTIIGLDGIWIITGLNTGQKGSLESFNAVPQIRSNWNHPIVPICSFQTHPFDYSGPKYLLTLKNWKDGPITVLP